MSKLQSAEKALIEGKFLKKTIRFAFTKLPVIIVEKIDWCIGCLARAIYAMGAKVDPNQIMFISFQGDYTCNPKYIAEELSARGVPYRMVFSSRLASMRNGSFPKQYILVDQYSENYYKELAKSKLIIANSVEFLKKPVPKKRSQTAIETWHGSLGIKRFDGKVNSGRAWVAAAKRSGRYMDYIISNSTFENNVYRNSFWKNTEILEYGHPRNDILLDTTPADAMAIKKRVLTTLGLYQEVIVDETLDVVEAKSTEDTGVETTAGMENADEVETEPNYLEMKYVLYAPTFRDSYTLSCYNIDFAALTIALSQKFGGTWKVLVRLHPTIKKLAGKYKKKLNKKCCIDVTAYPDIQELMVMADVAITDYSSWIYDFVLTRRPGFIYATDAQSYVTERGFYYPLESTPFPVCVNNEDLLESVENFDVDKYHDKVEEFLREKGCWEDGQASKKVADKIVEIMESEK